MPPATRSGKGKASIRVGCIGIVDIQVRGKLYYRCFNVSVVSTEYKISLCCVPMFLYGIMKSNSIKTEGWV